jgi:hypothetical protein
VRGVRKYVRSERRRRNLGFCKYRVETNPEGYKVGIRTPPVSDHGDVAVMPDIPMAKTVSAVEGVPSKPPKVPGSRLDQESRSYFMPYLHRRTVE